MLFFFAACNVGLDPSWKKDEGLVLRFANLDEVDLANNRAVLQGDGYLYLITVANGYTAAHDNEDFNKEDYVHIHGPYSYTSGKQFKTTDIKAGRYEYLGVFYSGSELGQGFLNYIINSDEVVNFYTNILNSEDENLNTYASYMSQNGIVDIVGMGVLSDITIVSGRINAFTCTLVPKVCSGDNDGNGTQILNIKDETITFNLDSSRGKTRRFIGVKPDLSNPPDGSFWVDMNVEGEDGFIYTLASYDQYGKLIAVHNTSKQDLNSGFSFRLRKDTNVAYLYIEYESSDDLTISGTARTVRYASTNGGGDGDGQSPNSPASFANFFDNPSFIPDVIALTQDIKVDVQLTVGSDKTLTIDSNGSAKRRIYPADSLAVSMIAVDRQGVLNLENLYRGPEKKPQSATNSSLLSVSGGTLTATNVVLENINSQYSAGVIYVTGAGDMENPINGNATF